MDNQRNLLLAVVLCGLLLVGWEMGMKVFYPAPPAPPTPSAPPASTVTSATSPTGSAGDVGNAGDALPGEQAQGAIAPTETEMSDTREGGLTDPADIALQEAQLAQQLSAAGRVKIEGAKVSGSINPMGARIDDLTLRSYRQSVDKDSGPVRIFSPDKTLAQHFAQFGWVGEGVKLPTSKTLWETVAEDGSLVGDTRSASGANEASGTSGTSGTRGASAPEGGAQSAQAAQEPAQGQAQKQTRSDTPASKSASTLTLTPSSPVTLRHDNGEGQVFTIRFAIDDDYVITAEQKVTNSGDNAIILRPFGLIKRTSKTASLDTINVHSGPIGYFGEGVQFGPNYDDLAEDASEGEIDERTGWIGFTDIYWLSALIPQDGAKVEANFRAIDAQNFRADMIYQPVTIAAKGESVRSSRLYAGAKETRLLDDYEAGGVPKFGKAVDWGWFSMIAWPIWWLLTHLFDLVGNFGLAIICLTILIKAVLFPISQKQFASMAAMKAIQPKMKAIQERYKDDKQQQQKEIMALYKEEKVNPLAGCLPILIQIPIFFALYKTLMLSIEMRHQPFVLWIRDLSAPDPAHILNLFGLLPYEVPGFLAIGPLAVLLGVSMWLTFRLNPTAMDPMQRQIFAIMPWVLMFVMAPFAAGLLLYWITNNILTLAQQSYLYSKHPLLKAQAQKDKDDQSRGEAREKSD